MNDHQNIPSFPGRRRWAERRRSVADSISRSRTTILINMVIEIACTVILIIGFIFLIRFLFYWRDNIIELHFNIFLGVVIVFAIAWSVYIFTKLIKYYRRFKEVSRHKE